MRITKHGLSFSSSPTDRSPTPQRRGLGTGKDVVAVFLPDKARALSSAVTRRFVSPKANISFGAGKDVREREAAACCMKEIISGDVGLYGGN